MGRASAPRPDMPKTTSTERHRRWRKANPERWRAIRRKAQSRYYGTAKGMLTTIRWQTKQKG